MSNDLHNLLNELDLLRNEAVFFTNEENWKSLVSAETRKKLEKIKPTAIYIFDRNPYILFFDLIDNVDSEREQTIHKQVWSFDQAPLAFIVNREDIRIYNAFAYEKRTKDSGLQEIVLKEGQRKEVFSFWNLQSGKAWKWLLENYKQKKQNDRIKRVHQKLFDNIKAVREHLTKTTTINDDFANIIILRLIFVRYLIDRNVEINPEFINGKTIVDRRISFSDLIKDQGKLTQFFIELNRIFNGVLFKDNITLSIDQAEYLSLVFSEKERFNQPTLCDDFKEFYFSIFDFNIIPVEMISGIYESLIDPETKNADSAFYTPLFIVEHILTNTIDKFFDREKNSTECKVFDASMGSGIFLVQAFRRMVDREIALSGKNLSKKRLSEIATNNLWGIDVNPSAIKVACFSVYIAILDYEDPGTIMDQFHFKDMNFHQADIFETDKYDKLNAQIKQVSFDFILGNPPWKKDKSLKHLVWVNERKIYKDEITGKIEIAQNFLLRVREFMTENTVCSLIVTSPIFYNISSTSKTFKNEFLTTTNILSILDLSPVRRYIFDGKKVEINEQTGTKKTKSISNPALIITFKKTDGRFRESIIEHTSVKSNFFTKHYKTLVVEKFDRKQIQQSHFIDNEWMFKVALYGNTLDYRFLKRLEQNKERILNLIDGKKVVKGAGILKGNINDHEPYPSIIDKNILENEDVDIFYTYKAKPKTVKKEESCIKSGRVDNLYSGYQILIKEQAKEESELVISYSKDYVFRKGIFGITSQDPALICDIYGYMISNLYTYFIFSISCAWGVSTRPQIRQNEEYLSFPIAESNQKDELIRLVDVFIEPFRAFYSQELPMGNIPINKKAKQQIDEIINETYQVNGYEKDLIDYVLNVSRYQFQESKINKVIKPVREKDDIIEAYTEVFFSELEPFYPNEHLSVEVYNLNHFIALNFVFSNKAPINKINYKTKEKDEWEVLKKIAQTTSISQLSKDIFIQKNVNGFEENSFYIIKPNEYKCWHRAMAWYDVAEIKQLIEADELEYLIENPDAI
jgi:hypothetical protein